MQRQRLYPSMEDPMLGSKNSKNHSESNAKTIFCWWFQVFLMFTYFYPGEMIQFDAHIFQLGWVFSNPPRNDFTETERTLDPKSGPQKKGSSLKTCGGIPSGTDDR